MITVITPTGDRPEAFELTRKWMFSQTMQPDQWLVIDDGKIPLPEHLRTNLDYVRREPQEGEGHTLTLNMKEAVNYIKGDIILIFEDDDWYGPKYIETMNSYLQLYDLVGERFARYYHLPFMKYRRIGNSKHASFCQTGFTRKVLPIFIQCLEGDSYIDSRLWATVTEHSYLITDTDDKLKLHCSLKGLKGRRGIGTGHNEGARYYSVDEGLTYLIKWVGEENARIYMNHVGQSFESAKLIGASNRPGKAHNVALPQKGPRRVPVVPKENPIADNGRIILTKQKITVITCTGDRPVSFELCKKWMKQQTVRPNQWLVIDDGKEPIKATGEFEYHRRVPTANDYTHTLCLNLLMALRFVKNDKIIIMEDDDWYHPTYIDYMSKLVEKADLVGLGNLAFYYPKIYSYLEKRTVKQPAFSQTAFREPIIPILEEICARAPQEYNLCGKGLIDEYLWKHPLQTFKKERKVKLTVSLKTSSGKIIPAGTVFDNPVPEGLIKKAEKQQGATFVYEDYEYQANKLIVSCEKYITMGMKGMPGRLGLTTHHNIENRKYKKDEGKKFLESVVKKDMIYYTELFS